MQADICMWNLKRLSLRGLNEGWLLQVQNIYKQMYLLK